MSLTKEILLALQGLLEIGQREVGKAEVAVGSAHGHPVLEVLGQGQILFIVPDGLLEVAQAVMSISQKVTCFRLTLNGTNRESHQGQGQRETSSQNQPIVTSRRN